MWANLVLQFLFDPLYLLSYALQCGSSDHVMAVHRADVIEQVVHILIEERAEAFIGIK